MHMCQVRTFWHICLQYSEINVLKFSRCTEIVSVPGASRLQALALEIHKIIEWFRLEETLKII